jgi:Mg-chelatase subunit ChlD
MSTWALKRQIAYISSAVILVFLFVFIYSFYTKPKPNCFDGILNNNEVDIDCGGLCEKVCKNETATLITKWANAIEVAPGFYDIVALIENPNVFFGIPSLKYKFEVYDNNNTLLETIYRETFVNRKEQFLLFSGNVALDSIPYQVFVEFETPKWKRIADQANINIDIDSEFLVTEPKPRLTATLVNRSTFDLENLDVKALIYNKENSVIAVSSTEVSELKKDIPYEIFFTWPKVLPEREKICKIPLDIMLLFDRSGSMNDDEKDPPQPITDAKNAALTFVDNFGDNDQGGLVSFATNALSPIDQVLTTDHNALKNSLSLISILPEDEVGFTNLGEAILNAKNELLSERGNVSAKKGMVILTDGKANAPKDPGGEVYAKEKALEAHLSGISIYAIGLGGNVNGEFLSQEISSNSLQYYPAVNTEELVSIYKDISESICPEKTYITNILYRVNNVGE